MSRRNDGSNLWWKRFAAPIVSVAIAATACSDQPTDPAPTVLGQRLAAVFGEVVPADPVDVPEMTVDLPRSRRPWDDDDQELVRAVERSGGVVMIGFKEQQSVRVRQDGVRRALTKGTITAATNFLRASGAEILYEYRSWGGVAARIDPADAPRLQRHPLVDFLEPDEAISVSSGQAPQGRGGSVATASSGASSVVNEWHLEMVNAPASWAVTSAGAGVKVMYIGTGHEPTQAYVPQVPVNNCGGLYDGCSEEGGLTWEGTHHVSTMVGNAPIWNGVAKGVADADVYVWGACYQDTAQALVICSQSQAAAGLDAARFAGVGVAQVQYTHDKLNLGVSTAVAAAWSADMVIVAPAGGGQWTPGTVVYPAAYAHVLGVSGLNADSSFASPGAVCSADVSNFGSMVDFAAPFYAKGGWEPGYWAEICGTGNAAAIVLGVAAIVRGNNPAKNNQWVVDAMTATAVDLGVSGRDDLFGYGLPDAEAAATYGPAPVGAQISGPSQIYAKAFYSWTVLPSGGNGSYTYSWKVRYGTGSWISLGNGQTQGLMVYASDPDFQLKATVSSGGSSNFAVQSVENCISGGCQIPN